MQDLKGKVAVVTGGASGIGRAMAATFAAEGMAVVLADVEERALRTSHDELTASGAKVSMVPTDVSSAASVQALADAAFSEHGAVHVLCNNAGVANGGALAALTHADWKWVIDVNLWGVINGISAFLPRMSAQKEGHIVNTASSAGLTPGPFNAAYAATKHAVVSISEALYHELASTAPALHTSVLCPSAVQTRIYEADRNRPAGHVAAVPAEAMRKSIASAISAGISPAEVARNVLDAIRSERFWILTHPEIVDDVQRRALAIAEGRNPDPI